MPADLRLVVVWLPEWHVMGNGGPWPTHEEARSAIARYNAAVVESSPEVAALRRERDELRARNDYLSRRVAALRAEKKAGLCCDHGVVLCEACSRVIRDEETRSACEDCTLCAECSDAITRADALAGDDHG